MNKNRAKTGFVWGVVATLAMSILMVTGLITGLAPMPGPIPEALVSLVIGGAPKPVRMVVAITAHLLYGGIFGALLAETVRPISIWKGLGFGALLWVVMGIVFLPLVGWGFFGTAITPKIAVATLVLHLIYGGTLGWALVSKSDVPQESTSSVASEVRSD